MTTLSPTPQLDSALRTTSPASDARAFSLAGRGRLSRTFVLVAALLALVLAAFFADRASALTTAANCALPGSTFQGGDGNQNTPTLAEQTFCTEHLLPTSRDWQDLSNVTNSQDPQAQDSMFSGGDKESAPGSWGLENAAGGVTPGKANILSGWSQTDPQPADTFLYLAFERAATTGDTFLTFELNKVKGLWENSGGAKIPCRTTGDVLISYNVGGNSSVNVVLYRWVTDESTPTVIPPDPTTHACATKGHFEPAEGTPVAPPFEQGEMNFAGPVANFLTDGANPPTPATFEAGSFGEASLNLTAIFEGAKLGPCFSFGQMWMSSRSSESIDSQLQDYVGPVGLQANSCSISGRKFDDANGSGVDDPAKPGLGGWTIQLLDSTGTNVLRTTTTASDGTYTFTNTMPGSYVVREVGQTGWTCDYPATGSGCQHAVTLNGSNVNSSGNDFGNRPTSTVTTTQEPAAGVIGSKFGDSANVSGSSGAPTPTGTVEFTLYSDNHCGTVAAGPISETLSAGSAAIPDASKVAPSTAGNYWWVATYGGDLYNAKAASGCAAEPVTVGPAAPQIKTTQLPDHGTVGDTFKDSATVSGLFGAHPGGEVSWKLYDNSTCEGDPVASDGPVTVSHNGEYSTPTGASPTQAATYYWVASYSGDSNNTAVASGCAAEPVTVGPAAPQIKTTQLPDHGTVGDTFKDSATVSGLFGAHPGGEVSWKLYDNSTCEGDPVASDGPVTVSHNGEYTTPTGASPTQAATYYWVASYSGDSNNTAVASGCAAEPVTVGPAAPQIKTTQLPDHGTVGDTFKDSATVSGLFGAHPGGEVSWKLYDNSTCEGDPVASDGPVTVSHNGEYTTPTGASPTQAATYYWVASYSGDSNNTAVASGCAAEPVTVGPAAPQIKTTQLPDHGTVGDTFKDSATVSGLFGAHPGGEVSWKLYDNSTCEGDPVASDGPVTVSHNGEYSTPTGASPTQAATYYWVASYSGDSNNTAVASGCAAEPVTVGPAAPQIKTTQLPDHGTVGDTFKDSATVSGLFGAHPGGEVSWKLYDNSTCEGDPVASDGPVTVSHNGEYSTPTGASPTQAATYYWVASYSGDSNNTAVASGCAAEPVTVGPAAPQIKTTQLPDHGTVGDTFKDSATVSGLFGAHPGGEVSWKLYDNSTCEGDPVASDGPVTVSHNGEYSTPTGASPTQAATYYWVASYSGDSNNTAVASGCAAEPVTVGPAAPQIKTTQLPDHGTVGDTFKDSATVSGLFGAHPGGEVSWKLYDNSTCEGDPVASDGPVTVSHNGEYSTPTGASPTQAATYYWVASYSGDSNNTAVASGCAAEPVTVGPAAPQIKTTQLPDHGTVGDTFKDSATVSGLFGAHPGGEVSWKLYDNSTCEGDPVASDGPVTVSHNGEYSTPTGASPTQAATYYWVASYSGDSNNTAVASGCAAEPVTVGPAAPQIKTTQLPDHGTVGDTFKDSATVSGLFGAHPGGEVSWKLYDNSTCEGDPVASDGPVTVSHNGEYTTPTGASPTQAATYYWVASYSGDSNNTAVASGCAAEPVTVGPAAPQIKTTQLPDHGTVGDTFKDSATVSGLFGAHPGGEVSWKLYDNSTCEGDPVASDGPVTVSHNGEYSTPTGASPTQAATYYWVASYSGDSNNTAVASGCAAEPVTVGPAAPQIKTTQLPDHGTVGDTFKDSATVSGLFGAHPGGEVSWKLYDNSTCEGDPVASDGPVTVSHNGEYSTPTGASPTQAATYYWVASYSGDSNNTAVASGCAAEPVTVGPAAPQIKTTQLPDHGTVGDTFKDSATVSGLFGAHPGGEVSWKLYDNSTCEGDPVASDGPVTVSHNGEYTTPTGASPTQAATYYWVASYSGDSNNTAVASGCAAEPVTVGPAAPQIKTTQLPDHGTVGDTFKDSATVSGLFGAHPGGEVSWKLYDNSTCEGDPVASDGPVTVSHNGEYSTPTGASPTQAATYYWVASYSGDSNNTAVASGCAAEPVTVGPAAPQIKTTQLPDHGTVGDTFKDSATVSGLFGAHPGGEVSWKLYDNSTCEGDPVASDGPVTVSHNGEYTTPTGASPTQAATYYWVASYSGDSNNTAVASGCAAEPVTVSAVPTTPTPPPAPAPAPAAKVSVLAAIQPSGLASAHGPQACVARSSRVVVKGREIASATFFLNGHKVKTVVRPDKQGRYGIMVQPPKEGAAARVKVIVLFSTTSQTKAKTLHAVVVRCPVLHPKFTG